MTPQQKMLIVLIGLAVFGLAVMLMSARRSAKKAAKVARHGGHAVSLLGRVLVLGALIAGGQWLVIRFSHDTTLLWAALGLPALLAAATVTRSLTVTTIGGRR